MSDGDESQAGILLKEWQRSRSESKPDKAMGLGWPKQNSAASLVLVNYIRSPKLSIPGSPAEGRAMHKYCHLLFFIDENAGVSLHDTILSECASIVRASLTTNTKFIRSYITFDFSLAKLYLYRDLRDLETMKIL